MFTCPRCGDLLFDDVEYHEVVKGYRYYTVTLVEDGEAFVTLVDEDLDIQDSCFKCLRCGGTLNEDHIETITHS